LGLAEERVFSQKKIIAMSSVNHREVFAKPSRCRYQTIGKTFLYHREDFFSPLEDVKKNTMMFLQNHYSVLLKTL
jgi:hypothetical protein